MSGQFHVLNHYQTVDKSLAQGPSTLNPPAASFKLVTFQYSVLRSTNLAISLHLLVMLISLTPERNKTPTCFAPLNAVFRFSDKVMFKTVCSDTETSV